MNAVPALLTTPWLVLVGWSLVLSLWVSTMTALALAVWRLVWRGASAEAQYRVALASLAAAVILSLAAPVVLVQVSATAPRRTLPIVLESSSPASRPAPASGGQDRAPEARPLVLSWAAAALENSSPSASKLALVGTVWGLGALLALAWLSAGWLAAARLRARATLLDEGPIRETFEQIARQANVDHARVAVSSDVEAPVVVGIASPTVILPTYILDHLPPRSLAPVLAHELAHIARRDYAVNLAQCVAEALLFHSPAIWWTGRQIRQAREFRCDDASVRVADDRVGYIEALTLIARLGSLSRTRPVLGMAGPRLITRVRRLLEGEPPMSMPFARTAGLAAMTVLLATTLPLPFSAASAHLSTQLFAAGATQDGPPVPLGFPQRQEGSSLRILRAESTLKHVCGTFEVQNVSPLAVAQVRMVGVLSFKPSANRPVQIFESEWVSSTILPGATARLDAGLIDIETARREAAGEHVQAFCALREVVYENRSVWGITPNSAATTDREALSVRGPTIPRAFVGQTSAATYPRVTLCLDEKGAEYSPGAQVAIRDEPGKAAHCTREGQWVEVDQRTGTPLASDTGHAQDAVALELLLEGSAAPMTLKSTFGELATLRMANGRTWGFVPALKGSGAVEIALHDLSTRPHRLIGTRTLTEGESVRFHDVEPALTLRLVSQ